MSNVNINKRTAVHAQSNGMLTTQDVCKVPGKVCTSTQFVNIAESKDAAQTAGTVSIAGQPACHAKSIFGKSTGDEAGRCGGVQSGTTKGRAEFITFSNDVFIEGKPAVRQGDMMVSNLRNTPPAPLVQPAAGDPPALKVGDTEAAGKAETPYHTPWEAGGAQAHLLKGQIEQEGN